MIVLIGSIGIVFMVVIASSLNISPELCGLIGVILMIVTAIYASNHDSKENEKEMNFRAYQYQEKREKELAYMSGTSKYNEIISRELAKETNERDRSIIRAKMESEKFISASYNMSKHDDALLGGIASGIAGPAYGAVTSAHYMSKNAQVDAEKQNALNTIHAQTMQALESSLSTMTRKRQELTDDFYKNHHIDWTYSPIDLQSRFEITCYCETLQENKNSACVKVYGTWMHKYVLWIDGAFRAKLYTEDGKYAGCAYLILPKDGAKAGEYGNFQGVCASARKSNSYQVKIEPRDLWVYGGSIKESKLEEEAYKAHDAIITEMERKFKEESSKI